MSEKRYWQSLEDKALPPIASWKTPEFKQTIKEMMEKAKTKKFSRKDFIKVMGASAVMLQAACRRPYEQIVPAVIQAPEYTPGEKLYYASSTPEGTGIIIHTREGRPIKIAGNPEHPITKGGLRAFNAPDTQDLYDPDRLRYPVFIENKRKKKAKKDEILSKIQSQLSQGNYVIITNPIQSPSTKKLISEFLKIYPEGKHLEFRPDPTLKQISEAQKLCYNQEVLPFYRFDKASLIVAIENDFLGTMPGSEIYTRWYTEKRNINYKNKGFNTLIVFESMLTLTGSHADHRFPIKPGDSSLIALSIASELNNNLKVGPYANNQKVIDLLKNYSPEKIAPIIGIPVEKIQNIAKQLEIHKGKSIVITGSPLIQTKLEEINDTQIAVNFINTILGNDGKTIDYANYLGLSPGNGYSKILKTIEEVKEGKIKTVIFVNTNLAYYLPESVNLKEILKKAFVVSLSDRIDETGYLSNAVLPLSHYLESWGDVETLKGVYSIIQPAIRPLYDTLSFEDYLIQIAGGIGGTDQFYDYLKKQWSDTVKNNFTNFWISILQAGYYQNSKLEPPGKERNFNLAALDYISSSAENNSGFRLGLFYQVNVLDGSKNNNGYRLELPDPITKTTWGNYVAILPETARKLKLKQGYVVEIKTKTGSIKLPLHLQPGIHPEAILIPLGFGRNSVGKTGNNVGVNAVQIASVKNNQIVFSGLEIESAESQIFKFTGDRQDLAITQVVYRLEKNTEHRAFFAMGSLPNAPYDGSSQYDRQLVLETTYKDLQAGWKVPEQTIEYPENASLMKEWEYEGVRWHMVIDLNLCTGCGACVTSCNLENNIPIVGKEELEEGSGGEMHWMRIDRYYSGDESNPEVVFQPMLCQQCENAPCENVCPVGATSHTDEGINAMAYNRCIGTRYCMNNCPYKVRRFNWYEYWNWMEGAIRHLREPQHLGLNPDVTVRRRGVIEKCTFCIQRLNKARIDAKAKGLSRVPDGSVKTACQEVCPANAIYFGDVNDPNSEVSKLAKKGRGYKVLDFLGVKPSITYLAKARNPIV